MTKRITLFAFAIGVLMHMNSNAQVFTAVSGCTFDSLTFPACNWGDFDNDGDFDLVANGVTPDWSDVTEVYVNDGGVLAPLESGMSPMHMGTADWVDFDSDGDLDIFVSGMDYDMIVFAQLYKNDEGSFSVGTTSFTNTFYSSSDWGDYDNDGDPDLLLTGVDEETGVNGTKLGLIYNNDNGAFTEISSVFPGVYEGSAKWGDYDNDGDLDILLVGNDNNDFHADIYQNNDGAFTDISAGMEPIAYGTGIWSDLDADGDLDVVLCGQDENYTSILHIYTNNGSGFDLTGDLSGVNISASSDHVAAGDYDNDGDMDLVMGGMDDNSNYVSMFYKNDGSSWTLVSEGIGDFGGNCSLAWADYDNDNDLDLAIMGWNASMSPETALYENTTTSTNTLPTAPANLNSVVDGTNVTLSWDAATDNETPDAGLTYNVRIGTAPGEGDVLCPMAITEGTLAGTRTVAKDGNVFLNTSWTIKNLSDGTYYWSVQAIDGAYKGSDFATEAEFTIGSGNNPPTALDLSSAEVDEGVAIGTIVGEFSTTDPDAGDTHTYSFVSGTGGEDNESFTIDANMLETAEEIDYDVQNSYNILVQTDDGNGGTFTDAFVITVNEAGNILSIAHERLIIYPNPTNDFITIECNNIDIDRMDIELHNISGILVKAVVGISTEGNVAHFNVENVEKGFYILKIKMGNQEINKTIVVQ